MGPRYNMSDSVDILSKLFDTLKDASEKNEQATQRLVEQQIVLVGKIKSMPIEELKTALKDHAKQSEADSDSCNGLIELKTGEIMDMIRICTAKINKMFAIVTAAVFIATTGYIAIKYLADDHVPIEQLREEIRTERKAEQDKMIKALQEEMRRLHSNGDPHK